MGTDRLIEFAARARNALRRFMSWNSVVSQALLHHVLAPLAVLMLAIPEYREQGIAVGVMVVLLRDTPDEIARRVRRYRSKSVPDLRIVIGNLRVRGKVSDR